MKTLIAAAALLLASTFSSHADTEDCKGRVAKVGNNHLMILRAPDPIPGCDAGHFSSPMAKSILRICPLGSYCHVRGRLVTGSDVMDDDRIKSIYSVRPMQAPQD